MINVVYYHVYKCLINNTATLIDSYKTHKLTPLIKSYKTICTHLSQYILSITDKQVSGQPIFTPNYSNNSDKVIIYCILCLASVIHIPSKGTEAKKWRGHKTHQYESKPRNPSLIIPNTCTSVLFYINAKLLCLWRYCHYFCALNYNNKIY